MAVVVVRSGLSVSCSMVSESCIMLTETAKPSSFIPSRGAYNAIIACAAGRSERVNPSIRIKSVFTVDMEAYPSSGPELTIIALQTFQSKFLPNSQPPSLLFTDKVLHPKGALSNDRSGRNETRFSVK